MAAAEMGDRRIDRQQEIELRQRGRRLGEIENAAPDIVHQAAGAELLDVALMHAALQAEHQQLGIAGQRQELRERRRALAVLRLAGHGGPVDADAQPGLLDAAELDAAVGRRMQIGGLGGQRVEVGAAEMRQRHHRGMEVEGRQLLALGDDAGR